MPSPQDLKGKIGFLKQAVNKLPALKYLMGVAAIGIVVSIIQEMKLSGGELPVKNMILVFVFMILLFVFSVMTKSDKKHYERMGRILGYVVILGFSVFFIIMLTSYLLNFPKPISEYDFFDTSGKRKKEAIEHIEAAGLAWKESDKSINANPLSDMSDSKLLSLMDDIKTLQPECFYITYDPMPYNTDEVRKQATLTTLNPLADIKSLKSLKIKYSLALADITALGSLTNLEALNLDEAFALQNIDAIKNLSKLQFLSLKSEFNLKNFDGLQNLKELKGLNVEGCKCLTNVDAFTRLPELKFLTVCVSALNTFDGLNQCTKLEELDAHSCMSLKNVDGLNNLSRLWYLDLGNCQFIENVNGLSGLTSLKNLNLGQCGYLKDIEGLRGNTSLESLALFGCLSLKNIAPLKTLTGLKDLSLQGCPNISRKDVEDLQAALPNTKITF